MCQLKMRVKEARARLLKPIANAVPYMLCTGILAVGCIIGYSAAKIEAADQIMQLKTDQQNEIIRLQSMYKPFLDALGERVGKAADKASQAAEKASEASAAVKRMEPQK